MKQTTYDLIRDDDDNMCPSADLLRKYLLSHSYGSGCFLYGLKMITLYSLKRIVTIMILPKKKCKIVAVLN